MIVQVGGANLKMEVDTGAAISILHLCKRTSTDQRATTISIHYQGHTAELEVVIVAGTGPCLLGLEWLQKIYPLAQPCIVNFGR